MNGCTHILFVNGDYKDETNEIGKLIHDFICTKPNEMYYPNLAERVRFLKEDPKGVEEMCKVMDDIRKKEEKRTAMKRTVMYVRNLKNSLDITTEKAMEIIQVPIAERADVAQLVSSQLYL